MSDQPKEYSEKRVFGRKRGRGFNKSRREAMERLLPHYSLAPAIDAGKAVDPAALFPTLSGDVIFEIGFGDGEHLNALIKRFPDNAYIGAEPFETGMANFLRDLEDSHDGAPPENLAVYMDDALTLMKAMSPQSLDRIYLLNPDPWPKKRHHKRRFIQQASLDEIARVLKPGGILLMATDVDDLAEWMAMHAAAHTGFDWDIERAQDWRTPPPEWIETRYAFKGRTAGRNQSFLRFVRK